MGRYFFRTLLHLLLNNPTYINNNRIFVSFDSWINIWNSASSTIYFFNNNISKKKKSRECPNCKIEMEYLEDLDAYQCPKCKKKFRDKYKD